MTDTVGSFMAEWGLDLTLLDRTGTVLLKSHLNDWLVGYGHETGAYGGFLSATINLATTITEAEWWFDHALGTRVLLTCDAGREVWSGFVNTVTIKCGDQTERRGPLMDVVNKTYSTFTPLDWSVFPPVRGNEQETAEANDTASQALYGILQKILTSSQTDEATALEGRDVYLKEGAYPKQSGDISLSGAAPASISIDCLGMIYWLLAYIYTNRNAGSVDLRTKITAILAADPNGYISTDYSKCAANAYTVGTTEVQRRFAGDIIKALTALGFTPSGTRALFGIWENAQAVYQQIPSTIAYEHFLSWQSRSIRYYDRGAVVPPWLVRAGNWLIVPDFMIRLPVSGTAYLNTDVRTKFLESVRYTAPLSLDLSGGKTDRLSSLLARLTYSGGVSGGG